MTHAPTLAVMSVKEQALHSIQQLPENVTWDEIEERVRMLAAIQRGEDAIAAGKIVPHEEVKKRLRQWIGQSTGQSPR